MLPPELLTFVILTGLPAVYAQVDDTSAVTLYTNTPDIPSVILTSTATPIVVTSTQTSSGDGNDFAPAPTPPIDEPLPEAQPTEDVYPCDLPDPPDWCNPPGFVQPDLPTATGWDDWGEWNNDNIGFGGGDGAGILPSGTVLRPPEQMPVVVTTRTPTIVDIRTSIEPSTTKEMGEGRTPRLSGSAPVGGEQTEQQKPPLQPTGGGDVPQTGDVVGKDWPAEHPAQPAPGQHTAGSGSNTADDHVPTSEQIASPRNRLLDIIINRIGKAQPGAQPTQAISSTAGVSGEHVKQQPQLASPADSARGDQGRPAQSEGATIGPTILAAMDTASTQDAIAVDDAITLGLAALSLTPGLSTIIGAGTDTTLIAIQTDNASRTIITVSSSGTAITATITDTLATVTLPKTGFDASITDDAGRGVHTLRSWQDTPTVSSKGVANENKAGLEWTGAVLGLLGAVVAL